MVYSEKIVFKLTELYPAIDEIIDANESKIGQLHGKELLDLYCQLHGFYRLKAVGALLLELDTMQYVACLKKSGQLRISVLTSSKEECNKYLKISQSNGFFDLLSINDLDSAKKVTNTWVNKWCNKFEYEEDYLYILLLYQILNQASDEKNNKLILNLESLLEGEEWVKLEVCKTILNSDTPAFNDKFEQLLVLRELELEKQEKSLSRDEIDFLSGSNVYTEGIALLNLARDRGISIKEEYLYCPREALLV